MLIKFVKHVGLEPTQIPPRISIPSTNCGNALERTSLDSNQGPHD